MGREYAFEIKQILINYESDELEKLKMGDTSIVPSEVLSWNGPGRENGYGYGEHVVKRYLNGKGFPSTVSDIIFFQLRNPNSM